MSGKANSLRETAHAPEPVPAGAAVAVLDRRSARREATRAEIVAAAWEVVREQGLAGLNLRDLGARVGLRAQSLYSYFESKDAIYDAMFRQGLEQQLAWMAPAFDDLDRLDPVAAAVRSSERFVSFCTSDPVRYQLLFQRTIPGFEPSAETYALAVLALTQMADALATFGIDDPEGIDLWTAVITGLIDQQLSNDPGGDRWERLVERSVRMLLAELAPHLLAAAPSARPSAAAPPGTSRPRTRSTTSKRTTP